MESMVYRIRQKEFGNWEQLICNPPLVYADDDSRSFFLLFQVTVLIDAMTKDSSHEKIIGWGHPNLIRKLKSGQMNVYIDCTFKVCPKGFYQLFILMVYVDEFDSYVPIFYVLMQSKRHNAYKCVLSNLIYTTNWNLNPKTITCDFEKGMLKSIEEEFHGEDIPIVCCLFHWKQALRRKLEYYHIPKNEISELMGHNGKIDILTVIPIDEIVVKGIPYVRSLMDERGNVMGWDTFWRYFIKTWTIEYKPTYWNVSLYKDMDVLRNRTNNPLERYNRTLNEMFPTPHPTMTQFVSTIKGESQRFVEMLKDIEEMRQEPVKHKPVKIPHIPIQYEMFSIDEKEDNNVDRRKKRK